MTNYQDARQLMYNELSKLRTYKKIQGDSYMIQCPFHDDNTPSCGVNLSIGTEIPLGTFHCFGCNEKGGWNKLADKLGFEKIKDWQKFEGRTNDKIVIADLLTTETSVKQLLKDIGTKEAIQWPINMKWRGYEGKLINKLGGIYFNDKLTDELMLVFPIYINGKYKGGVRAYLEKQVGGTSYLTTKGPWAKSYGLFGYDYIKGIMNKRKYKSIVLSEGPRDFLRLASNSIPALSILGGLNFDKKKFMYVLSICPQLETIYVLSDNDSGGNKMFKAVKEVAADVIEVVRIKLPVEKDKKGKLIKMDPDSAPQYLIDEIKNIVESKQN